VGSILVIAVLNKPRVSHNPVTSINVGKKKSLSKRGIARGKKVLERARPGGLRHPNGENPNTKGKICLKMTREKTKGIKKLI